MKRERSLRELVNMNFGFLGIQFGWSLQMANMSAIYECLGAKPDEIPLLWLAAPLTGLLVQPLIGYLSDRTWTRLGRRRPYFLIGAILSTAALIAMPNVKGLLMAALLLWVLDASINISMEPFRAFVSDLLPASQRTRGFAMQSLLIGLASVFASAMPALLRAANLPPGSGPIPNTVRVSFYIGAFSFLTCVLWTIFTTPEDPPVAEEKQQAARGVLPKEMWILAPVQIVTWLGLFAMWLYFPPVVARHVFLAPDEASPLYARGIEWAGLCASFSSLVTFLTAFLLESLTRRLGGEGRAHAFCLAVGGAGIASVFFVHNPYLLLVSMGCAGVAWAAVLSLPYAILARNVRPDSAGLTMGLFNFFIVLPQIMMALGFGWVMHNVFGDNRALAMLFSGGCFLAAALLAVILLGKLRPSAAANAPDHPR